MLSTFSSREEVLLLLSFTKQRIGLNTLVIDNLKRKYFGD
jgi:hypothetical protein